MSIKEVQAALGTPQLWVTVQQAVDGAAEWHDEELCTLLEQLCDTPNNIAPNALDTHNSNIVVRQLIGKLVHRSKPGNPSRPVQCLQHMLNKVLGNKKASLSAKLTALLVIGALYTYRTMQLVTHLNNTLVALNKLLAVRDKDDELPRDELYLNESAVTANNGINHVIMLRTLDYQPARNEVRALKVYCVRQVHVICMALVDYNGLSSHVPEISKLIRTVLKDRSAEVRHVVYDLFLALVRQFKPVLSTTPNPTANTSGNVPAANPSTAVGVDWMLSHLVHDLLNAHVHHGQYLAAIHAHYHLTRVKTSVTAPTEASSAEQQPKLGKASPVAAYLARAGASSATTFMNQYDLVTISHHYLRLWAQVSQTPVKLAVTYVKDVKAAITCSLMAFLDALPVHVIQANLSHLVEVILTLIDDLRDNLPYVITCLRRSVARRMDSTGRDAYLQYLITLLNTLLSKSSEENSSENGNRQHKLSVIVLLKELTECLQHESEGLEMSRDQLVTCLETALGRAQLNLDDDLQREIAVWSSTVYKAMVRCVPSQIAPHLQTLVQGLHATIGTGSELDHVTLTRARVQAHFVVASLAALRNPASHVTAMKAAGTSLSSDTLHKYLGISPALVDQIYTLIEKLFNLKLDLVAWMLLAALIRTGVTGVDKHVTYVVQLWTQWQQRGATPQSDAALVEYLQKSAIVLQSVLSYLQHVVTPDISEQLFTTEIYHVITRLLNTCLHHVLTPVPETGTPPRAELQRLRLTLLRGYAMLYGLDVPSYAGHWPTAEQLSFYQQCHAYHVLNTSASDVPPVAELPQVTLLPAPHLMQAVMTVLCDTLQSEHDLAVSSALWQHVIPAEDHVLLAIDPPKSHPAHALPALQQLKSYHRHHDEVTGATTVYSFVRDYVALADDPATLWDLPLTAFSESRAVTTTEAMHTRQSQQWSSSVTAASVDVAVTLFPVLLFSHHDSNQSKILDQFTAYVHAADQSVKPHAQLNLLTALLLTAKYLAEQHKFLALVSGKDGVSHVLGMVSKLAALVEQYIASVDPLLRRISAHVLALTAPLLGDSFAAQLVQKLFNTVQARGAVSESVGQEQEYYQYEYQNSREDEEVLSGCLHTLALLLKQIGGIKSTAHMVRTAQQALARLLSSLKTRVLASPSQTHVKWFAPRHLHCTLLTVLEISCELALTQGPQFSLQLLTTTAQLLVKEHYDPYWHYLPPFDMHRAGAKNSPVESVPRTPSTQVSYMTTRGVNGATMCIARLLGSIVQSLGPELRLEAQPASVTSHTQRILAIQQCLTRVNQSVLTQHELHLLQQKILLFSPQLITHHLAKTLRHLLDERHLLSYCPNLRASSISTCRSVTQFLINKAEQQPPTESLQFLMDFVTFFFTPNPATSLHRLDDILVMLDKESSQHIRTEIKQLITLVLDFTRYESPITWLKLLQRHVTGTITAQPAAPTSPTTRAVAVVEDEEEGQMTAGDTQLSNTDPDQTRYLHWTTKRFAVKCLVRLMTSLSDQGWHYDLLKPAPSTERGTRVVEHVEEIVSTCYLPATSSIDPLRHVGLVAIGVLLQRFGASREVTGDDFYDMSRADSSHVRYLLAQQAMQLVSPLRQGLTSRNSLLVALSLPITCNFLIWAMTTRSMTETEIKKYFAIFSTAVTSALDKGTDRGYGQLIEDQKRLTALMTSAQLYVAAADLPNFAAIFSSFHKQLYSAWHVALQTCAQTLSEQFTEPALGELPWSMDDRTWYLLLEACATSARDQSIDTDVQLYLELALYAINSLLGTKHVTGASVKSCLRTLVALYQSNHVTDELKSSSSHVIKTIQAILAANNSADVNAVCTELLHALISKLGKEFFETEDKSLNDTLWQLMIDLMTRVKIADSTNYGNVSAVLNCVQCLKIAPCSLKHAVELNAQLLQMLSNVNLNQTIIPLAAKTLVALLSSTRQHDELSVLTVNSLLTFMNESFTNTPAFKELFLVLIYTTTLLPIEHLTVHRSVLELLQRLLRNPVPLTEHVLETVRQQYVQSWLETGAGSAVSQFYVQGLTADVITVLQQSAKSLAATRISALKYVILLQSVAPQPAQSLALTLPTLVSTLKSTDRALADTALQVLLRLAQSMANEFRTQVQQLPTEWRTCFEEAVRAHLSKQQQAAQKTTTTSMALDMSKYNEDK